MQKQAYNCVHNVLQAHAAAVQVFRAIVPAGKISINLNSDWGEPYSKSSPADKVKVSLRIAWAFVSSLLVADVTVLLSLPACRPTGMRQVVGAA